MNLVPRYNRISLELVEGEAFTLNDFCKNHFSTKCKIFYEQLNSIGTYKCPYGFDVINTRYSFEQKYLYTSLVLKDEKDGKLKGKGFIKNLFTKDELTRLIGLAEQYVRKIEITHEESKEEIAIITTLFHEIRKLSRDLDSAATVFQKVMHNQDEVATNIIDNILQTINLIMIRLNHYEFIKNPLAITTATVPSIQVYKKFDKARYIVTSKARDKNVYINFENECHFCISGFEVFDILPYILFDNAIKYCPNRTNILVEFNTKEKQIEVSNYGPELTKEELERLGVRGFRGKNAQKYPGSGLGLNMFQQICDLHNITYRYECHEIYDAEISTKLYKFKVIIDLNKSNLTIAST